MITIRTINSLHVSFFIPLWIFVFALVLPREAFSEVVVVAHPSVMSDSLSRKDVKKIFTLKQSHWDDGDKIKVFVLPKNSDTHLAFCRNILRLTPTQLVRKWSRVTYTGHGSLPLTSSDEAELFKSIISTPNAIGYVSVAFLKNLAKEKDRYVMPFSN